MASRFAIVNASGIGAIIGGVKLVAVSIRTGVVRTLADAQRQAMALVADNFMVCWASANMSGPSVSASKRRGSVQCVSRRGGTETVFPMAMCKPDTIGYTAVYDLTADSTGLYVADTSGGSCAEYSEVRKLSLSTGVLKKTYDLGGSAGSRPMLARAGNQLFVQVMEKNGCNHLPDAAIRVLRT